MIHDPRLDQTLFTNDKPEKQKSEMRATRRIALSEMYQGRFFCTSPLHAEMRQEPSPLHSTIFWSIFFASYIKVKKEATGGGKVNAQHYLAFFNSDRYSSCRL
jgi:hypothetical protein